MIAGRDRSVDLNRIQLLGSAQDAHHDAGKRGGGWQEVEATDRSGGDFDAPSRWQKARSSRHGCISREWPRGSRGRPRATRRGSTVTHRRGPVLGRRAAPDARCAQSPTTPYVGRKSGYDSAGKIAGQRGWPIPAAGVAASATGDKPTEAGKPTQERNRDRGGWQIAPVKTGRV